MRGWACGRVWEGVGGRAIRDTMLAFLGVTRVKLIHSLCMTHPSAYDSSPCVPSARAGQRHLSA